ncbi:hypothetical protein MYSTI_06714 [Myxococcus stipitatus DSM 14675]|uniref:Lipoprotein n=1 Tax=Myxococcus stipitatus (strain DSM 14675 / JCM 12634 / Mx s8) TaxID=1278073 RepID=L7UKD7_MYXSD|nr:hypothetical protein [Myxococcus stipitatus]AGC47987.1 hypothetical protein MYSTI_06714 [Myxococcus stipitatus DSM 14675]
MRLQVAATALLALSACSRTTEGTPPVVERVLNPRTRFSDVARVCNAQGGQTGWRVEVQGKRFAPTPADVLSDTPVVDLPEVTLQGPTPYTLRRDQVFYVRPELLLLDLPTRDSSPPFELAPGRYGVEVTNPLGGTSTLGEAFTVVAPPKVTRVVPPPNGYVSGGLNPIVIEGQDFQPGSSPIIILRSEGLADQPLFNVSVVSETRIETEIPPGSSEGRYDVVLTQPDGCSAVVPGAVDVRYRPPLGALSIFPRAARAASNTRIRINNEPTGAQRAFTGVPEVFIFAPLKATPTVIRRIALRSVELRSATEVTAEVPVCSGTEPPTSDELCPHGMVLGGPYVLEVVDPSGAVGVVPEAEGFFVTFDASLTFASGSAQDTGTDLP